MSEVNVILNNARKYLGVKGGSKTHKEIVDKYNANKPLPVGYKMKYTDDWCDCFITVLGIESGLVGKIGKECGVERHVDVFKKKGIWIEDGRVRPEVGDVIVYNWNKNVQPNDGWSDHIGIVEHVKNGIITTIEGNYNNEVKKRNIVVGSGLIRGYGRPKYRVGSTSEVNKKPVDGLKPNKSKFNLPVGVYRYRSFEKMRYGEDVRQIQLAMSSVYFYPNKGAKDNGCDGWYGRDTMDCVKRIQSMYGLKADGDYGEETRKLLVRLTSK